MKQKDKEELRLNKIRTELSIKRTLLSCKRSLLSYISTSCVFVSLALTYLKIVSVESIDWFVIVMFCIGVGFFSFGLIEYLINKKQTKMLFDKVEVELEEDFSQDE